MKTVTRPLVAFRTLLAFSIPIGLLTIAHAAAPVFWRVSTPDEFLQGEVQNVSIDAVGALHLGPQTEMVYDAATPFLWSTAGTADNLWIGSGNDGRVFHVTAEGTGTVVFDADALNVHAVAAAGADAAFVGTSPDGAVYRVDAAASSGTPVFDPDETYIWAIAATPPDSPFEGDLLVATGNAGRIYRVTVDGDATVFYDTRTTHVMALAFDRHAHLLAGTGSPGRVFRIAPDGRAFVVLDSEFDEIRAIRPAPDGSYYAVGVAESANRSLSASTSTSSNAAALASVTVNGSTSSTASAAVPATGGNGAASGGGAVYHIQEDGTWDIVWRSGNETPYDVVPANTAAGGILIGTGDDGKIFHVRSEPERVVLLTRAPAQQVTAFVPGTDGPRYYVTANPGKVMRLESASAAQGSYVSAVHDTSTVSTWGTLRWRARTAGDGTVRLFTRSGNTETPNDTWSEWSDPYGDASGSPITSPKARYLQWKAELRGTDETPSLLAVTAAYLPRNLRPRLNELTVHPPGVVFEQPYSGTNPPIAGLGKSVAPADGNGDMQTSRGRQVFRKGLQTFEWKAEDGNTDDLEFAVLYRAEIDDTWQPLASRLRDAIFVWNTTTAPDGVYIVRIVVTDAPSNAPGAALSGFRDSPPFAIDNSAPSIRVEEPRTEDGQHVTTFVVTDGHTPLQRVEYTVDMERWQVVYPIDGIADAQTERFEVRIDPADAARLVLRATDAMGNTATAAGP